MNPQPQVRCLAAAVLVSLLVTSGPAQESRPASRRTESLREAIAGATFVRVDPVNARSARPRAEETDPAAIARLVAGIRVAESGWQFRCGCAGEERLSFHRGDQPLAELTLHHGHTLRWDGWHGDALLLQESQDFLLRWLAERGITRPWWERTNGTRARAVAVLAVARVQTEVSPALAAALVADEDVFARVLRQELPEPQAQMLALLRVFGVSNEDWIEVGSWERRVQDRFADHDVESLGAAARTALHGADRLARRGAARLLWWARSPLASWRPADLARLRSKVLAVLQEAWLPDLRERAMPCLLAWAGGLSADQVARALQVGLHDPRSMVRRAAIVAAGRLGQEDLRVELLALLSGTPLAVVALAPLPAAEEIEFTRPNATEPPSAAERYAAALALGYLHSQLAVPLLRARGDDVALALLGEHQRLQPEHFTSRGQTQVAAVEAVVRCRGRTGLAWALAYETVDAWWEQEHVLAALRRMLLAREVPGRALVEAARSLPDLQEWFELHGQEYLSTLE